MIFGRRIPVILQTEAPECGIACVAMIATYHGFVTDLAAMRQRMSVSMKGTTLKTIAQIAETMKMSARGVKVSIDALDRVKLPAILHWDMNHFVVLTKVSGSGPKQTITVHDPARGRRVLNYRDTSQHFTGVAMEMLPTPGFRRVEERERISSWQLLSAAGGYKSTIAQIFLLSLALEVFAIATPFFLQLVIDRVLVGRDADFLTVLGIAFGDARPDPVDGDRAPRMGRRLPVHADQHGHARGPVRAARPPAARVVREAQHRRHHLALPQHRRDPAHADDHVRRGRHRRADGRADARRHVLLQRHADVGRARRRGAVRRDALAVLLPAAPRDRRAARARGEVRHAFHRDVARDDGDQAEHARAGAAPRLPEPRRRARQRRRPRAADRDRPSRREHADLRSRERDRDLARCTGRDGRRADGRHAVRVPHVQAAVPDAHQHADRQGHRVPHARPARRADRRHRADRARGGRRAARGVVRHAARDPRGRHRLRVRQRGLRLPAASTSTSGPARRSR